MDLSKYDFFFALLRSGLYGTSVPEDEIPSVIDWEQIRRVAKAQTVLALVADGASRLPQDKQPPKEVRDKLKKFALRNLQAHMLLNNTIAKAVNVLQEAGIRPVLLKGQGLAQCYANPLLRQCGDVDIYVGKQQYAKACEVCTAVLHDDPEPPHADAKHTGIMHKGVEIEIHQYVTIMQLPWDNRVFQPWARAQLDEPSRCKRMQIGTVEVDVPGDDFNAFYVFFHLWHHLLTGGIGVRHLCDIAMFLHHNRGKIDTAQLETLLDRLHLKKVWRSVGAILVERLGLPAEEMPLYDAKYSKKGDNILQPIMEVGNFGTSADRSMRLSQNQSFATRKIHNFRRITRISMLTFRAVPAHVAVHYTFKTIGAAINIIAGRQVTLKF